MPAPNTHNPSVASSDPPNPPPTHLTPSHAFPPSGAFLPADPTHARASLSKSSSTDSAEHHHHAEKGYASCASCRAEGKEPFRGHADGEEACACVVGEGAVPVEMIHRGGNGNAGKGGCQHGGSFFLSLSVLLYVVVLPRARDEAIRLTRWAL
ncbi:hypothetical protein MMC21_004009 [Puttea exsequens]|nr:hypothetical protein [Puttea exsequens]